MNPLTVNPVIVLDHALHSAHENRTQEQRMADAHHGRRGRRAVHAARSARAALERAGL